jgi:hypothetical protein
MFAIKNNKDWGRGVPRYKREDLMTSFELYDFALDIVSKYLMEQENYKFINANRDEKGYPSIVFEKDRQVIFVLVEAAVAPKMPTLSDERKEEFMAHSKKFKALAHYAPVGFGAADPQRFECSLALRGDAYYANFAGLEYVCGLLS